MKSHAQPLLCQSVNPSDGFDTCMRDYGHFGKHVSEKHGNVWEQEEPQTTPDRQKGGRASYAKQRGKKLSAG